MSGSRIVPLTDAYSVSREAGRRFLEAAQAAVQARGRFVAVLSGGSTPRQLYRMLSAGPLRPQVPWSRTVLLFGDERCVGPDHEDSNYRMVREALLDNVRVPERHVHRMEGELPEPTIAAARYEAALRDLYHDQLHPSFDLLLLGIGEDGHTASLFPGTAALDETERWVVANHVPHLDAWRLTMTLPTLCSARETLFLVSGAGKASVLAEAFGGRPHPTPHPCELVVPTDGTLHVLADAAALGKQ